MLADVPAKPPKPNSAATIATTKKIKVQLNIITPPLNETSSAYGSMSGTGMSKLT